MTTPEGYDYCTVFLDGADRQTVTDLIAAMLHAAPAPGRHALRVGNTVIDVVRNEWAGTSADFLGWPIKIDIGADPVDPAIVDYVTRILTAAWNLGWSAVAACDFEDELPDQGGRSTRSAK